MKRQWEHEELIEHWILGPWDLAQVGNKRGATRLGFAVLLKFFQREGQETLCWWNAKAFVSASSISKIPVRSALTANLYRAGGVLMTPCLPSRVPRVLCCLPEL
jgi:hypothetical protein